MFPLLFYHPSDRRVRNDQQNENSNGSTERRDLSKSTRPRSRLVEAPSPLSFTPLPPAVLPKVKQGHDNKRYAHSEPSGAAERCGRFGVLALVVRHKPLTLFSSLQQGRLSLAYRGSRTVSHAHSLAARKVSSRQGSSSREFACGFSGCLLDHAGYGGLRTLQGWREGSSGVTGSSDSWTGASGVSWSRRRRRGRRIGGGALLCSDPVAVLRVCHRGC